MARPPRPQRYRLVCEFELKDRGDYVHFRDLLYTLLRDRIDNSLMGACIDLITFEKCKDPSQ